MSDTYSCPAEGCDYGPLPLQSVCGHYGGKTDGAHAGGYEVCRRMLADDASGSKDKDSTGDSPSGAGTQPAGARDGLPEVPPAPDADGGGGESEHACPRCGSETDAVEPGTPFVTDDGQSGTTDAGDRWCDDCGGVVDGSEVLV